MFTQAVPIGVGKQPLAAGAMGDVGAAVVAQQCQQAGAEQVVAVSAAIASDDTHAHAVSGAVDVTDAQGANLGYAKTAGVHGLQCHAVHRMGAAGKETGDLFSREEFGLLLRHEGHGRTEVGGRS